MPSCSQSGWAMTPRWPTPATTCRACTSPCRSSRRSRPTGRCRWAIASSSSAGGNTAIDCAREARRLGAHVVTLAYRRTEEEMPAFPHEVAEAVAEDVQFHYLANPVRFLGTERLEGVECVEMRLGAPDSSGRHRPEPVPGSEFVIEADTAIKAIGQRPRSDVLSWVEGLGTERGRVVVDAETGATGNPKVFAAGDAVSGGSTVVEAVRQAKIAARGVDAALRRPR